MRHTWITHVAIAVAVWLSLVPLGTLLQGHRVLLASLPLLAASAVTGSVLSLLRVPRGVIFFAQGVAVVGVLLWRGLSLAGNGGPLEALRVLTAEGAAAVRTGAPPLEVSDGVLWLCLLLTAAMLLMVQLLADGLEQPGWSIAPLALVFGIAALILLGDVPWLYALPVVAAYVIVLLVGTPMGRDAAGGASRLVGFQVSRAVTAGVAGLTAAALALATSAVVPLGNQRPWAEDAKDGPIQLADPTLQLDEDLHRPIDAHVLTYSTDTGEPVYLRTVALTELTTEGAQLVPMNLSRFGLSGASPYPGDPVTVTVEMGVPSEYLPAPFAPRTFSADGTWTFDPLTLSIVASGAERAQQTVGLTYSVTSQLPNPTTDEISAASAGSGLDDVTAQVPDGLDPRVQTVLDAIVAQSDTDGEKALAIQAFLRSSRFSYSLEAPSLVGSDTISNFLLNTRSGYCVHFAMGMAVLSRMAGIPSRIAVGFAPGDAQGDGTYQVTAHDAHAWPELYFEGLGWVPFEPTPSFGGPAGTEGGDEPTDEPSAEPSEEAPSQEPSDEASEPTAEPSTPGVATDDGSSGSGGVGGILLALLVLAALAAPAVARIVQRRMRLADGRSSEDRTEGAWDEVRATFLDHGLAWPDGSPVPAATSAAEQLGGDGPEALLNLALAVEQGRFGRPDDTVDTRSAELVGRVRRAVSQASPAGRRALAWFLPASILRWRRR